MNSYLMGSVIVASEIRKMSDKLKRAQSDAHYSFMVMRIVYHLGLFATTKNGRIEVLVRDCIVTRKGFVRRKITRNIYLFDKREGLGVICTDLKILMMKSKDADKAEKEGMSSRLCRYPAYVYL